MVCFVVNQSLIYSQFQRTEHPLVLWGLEWCNVRFYRRHNALGQHQRPGSWFEGLQLLRRHVNPFLLLVFIASQQLRKVHGTETVHLKEKRTRWSEPATLKPVPRPYFTCPKFRSCTRSLLMAVLNLHASAFPGWQMSFALSVNTAKSEDRPEWLSPTSSAPGRFCHLAFGTSRKKRFTLYGCSSWSTWSSTAIYTLNWLIGNHSWGETVYGMHMAAS